MENILVSLFKGYADTCPIEVPLKTIISLLRDNQAVIEHTEKHRYYLEQKQVTAAAREKASCPCFAVSVRFEGGKQKANISEWTGICPVDIDHVPPERMEQCLELLKADKHTLLQYVTISGHGIRYSADTPDSPTTARKTTDSTPALLPPLTSTTPVSPDLNVT